MDAHKKVAFYTLGCKLNFSETSTIARNFQNEGFERVGFEEAADIYVINTCSVTENADKRFKTIVKNALKKNDKAYLIAVGCYAQLKPEELAAVDGVDLVLGATEKFKVTDYLNDLSKNDMGEVHSCEISEADFYVGSYAVGDRTRAFLKVQDGCDYKCTYCTIPLARGISRSDTLENVLNNAREISEKGIKEIVLTGVNIGDYGKGEFGNKKHGHTFHELVQALDAVKGIHRLRISSIEPNLLQNKTIEFVAQSNSFVPHFHIPLQSGSNEMDISYLHVFTYSERPNTEAVELPGVVPLKTRQKRSKMLRGLSVKKRRAFYESQLQSEHSVLFENENKEGYAQGFTENYVKVKTPWNPNLANTIHRIVLTEIDEDGLVRFDWC